MHARLSVSAVSSWNWSAAEDAAYWRDARIDQVGLVATKLAGGWPERPDLDGLRVTNLIAGTPDRLPSAVEFASATGAEQVVFTSGALGGRTWEQAADDLCDAISRSASASVPLALEHTNSLRLDLSFVTTLRDAVDLARRAGVGVCMEVGACWAERGLDATIREGVDVITLVQVNDFALGTRCTPDRCVPGDGDIPLRRIVGSLLDAGYGGVFDLEIVGPRIEAEGYRSAIGRSIDYLTILLTDALG